MNFDTYQTTRVAELKEEMADIREKMDYLSHADMDEIAELALRLNEIENEIDQLISWN